MRYDRCLIVLLVAATISPPANSCEILKLPPVKPVPDLLLLVGLVKDSLAPLSIIGVAQPAPAIVVSVTKSSSGFDQGAEVEVVPLGVDPGCEPIPWDAA